MGKLGEENWGIGQKKVKISPEIFLGRDHNAWLKNVGIGLVENSLKVGQGLFSIYSLSKKCFLKFVSKVNLRYTKF